MKSRLLSIVSLLLLPTLTLASGGDGTSDNGYVPLHRVPAPEFEAYAGGRLDVVRGEFFRVHQVLA